MVDVRKALEPPPPPEPTPPPTPPPAEPEVELEIPDMSDMKFPDGEAFFTPCVYQDDFR